MTDVENLLVIVLLCALPYSCVFATTYDCIQGQTVEIFSEQNGTIKTLEPGKSSYDDNINCRWVIDAGENNRIQITVVSTNLQWAPEYALCEGYDYLDIKDGRTETDSSIFTMCGDRNPITILTTGQYAYLHFITNEQNPYKYVYSGVTLNFQTFSASNCPPGWKQLSGDTFCYTIPDKPADGTDWRQAQHYCSYNQANLITIKNESEFSLIQGYGVGSGYDAAWIGLSDISHESSFKWIDNTFSYFSKLTESRPDSEDMDCVIQDFNQGVWLIKHCSRDRYPYICKTAKGNSTEVYSLPEDLNVDDAPTDSSFIIAITLGVLAGVVVVISSLAVYCYMQGKKQNKRTLSQNSTEENRLRSESDIQRTQHNWFNTTHTIDRLDSRPDPSAPPDTVGPPSYAEALGDRAWHK